MAADLRPKRRKPSDAPRRLDPARFYAKERIGTNGSRETFVPIPYSACNARPGSAAPLPVEASAGSVCAVAFPPPHVRKNRGFGNLSPCFAVAGRRRRGLGRRNPRSRVLRSGEPGAGLPKARFSRTQGSPKRRGRNAAGAAVPRRGGRPAGHHAPNRESEHSFARNAKPPQAASLQRFCVLRFCSKPATRPGLRRFRR